MTCIVCGQETLDEYQFEYGVKTGQVHTGPKVVESYRVFGKQAFAVCAPCLRLMRQQDAKRGLVLGAVLLLDIGASLWLDGLGRWSKDFLFLPFGIGFFLAIAAGACFAGEGTAVTRRAVLERTKGDVIRSSQFHNIPATLRTRSNCSRPRSGSWVLRPKAWFMTTADFLWLAVLLFIVIAAILMPPGPGTPLHERVPAR